MAGEQELKTSIQSVPQILALVAVRKAMDYMFSQHDLSFLDDVIPEKDKKKKEDEKKEMDSDADGEDVSEINVFLKTRKQANPLCSLSLCEFVSSD